MARKIFYLGSALFLLFITSASIAPDTQSPSTGWLFHGQIIKKISLPGGAMIDIPGNIPISDTTMTFAGFIRGGKGLYMPFVPSEVAGNFADIFLTYLAFDLTPGSEFLYLDCAPPDGETSAGSWDLPGGVILHVNRLVLAYNYDPINPPPNAPPLPPGFVIGGQGYSMYGQAQIEFPENGLFGSKALFINAVFFLSPDGKLNVIFDVPSSVSFPSMDTQMEMGNIRAIFFETANTYTAILHGRLLVRNSLSLTLDVSDDNTLRIVVDEEGLLSASGIVIMRLSNMGQAGMNFDYTRNGSLRLQSIGNISLGNGIIFYPGEGKRSSPILYFDSSQAGIQFGISAALDVPGAQGTQRINVSGDMTIENGAITSASAESGIIPTLQFPDGLRATDVTLRVVYANQSFGVEMSGKLDFGSGGKLDFSGNLEYNTANPQDIAFNVTLHPNEDITPFGNDIKIKISEFSMSLDTIPLKGSAHIEGDLYLPNNRVIAVIGTITENSIFVNFTGEVKFPTFAAGGYSGTLTLTSLEAGYTRGKVPPLHLDGSGVFIYEIENQKMMYCSVGIVESAGDVAVQLKCDDVTIILPGGIIVEVDNANFTASDQEFDAAITGARVVYMPGAPKGLDGKNANINIKYLRFNKSLDNEFLFLDCEPAEGQANAGQLHLFPNQAEFDVNCLVIAYNYGAISPKPARPVCLPSPEIFDFSGTGLSIYASGQLKLTNASLFKNQPEISATLTHVDGTTIVTAEFQTLTLPTNPEATITNGSLKLFFSGNTLNFGGEISGKLNVNGVSIDIDPKNPLAFEAEPSGLKSFSGGVELKLDSQNTVKLDTKYAASSDFSIASSAEITLASGLKLYPRQAGMPMIALDMTGQAAKFNVNAQVDIPGQNGLNKIGVTGMLETNPDGSLKSLDVKSQAQSEIIFSGGLRATEVNVRLVYENGVFGVEMSGKLDFGSGGKLDFLGRLQYNSVNPQDIAFNVTLHPNEDITPFGNDIKIKISEFSMSLDTIPLKGSAHIKGELYLPDNKTIEVSGTITERSIFLSIEGAIEFPEFSTGGYSGKLTINSLEVGYSDGAVPPFHVAGSGRFRYTNVNQEVMTCLVGIVESAGNIAVQLKCDDVTIILPGGIIVEVDNANFSASDQEFDAAITGARVVYMPGAPEGQNGKNANINIKYLRFNKSLDNEFLFLDCEPAEGQANAGQLHLFPNQAEFDVNCLVIAYNYGAISPKPARPDCLPGGFQFSGTGLSLFAKGDLRITDPNLMNLPQLSASLTYSNNKTIVSAAFSGQELMLPPNIIPPTTISDGFLELSFSDSTLNFGGKIGGTLKVGNNLNLTIDPANPFAFEAGTSGLKSFSGGVELKLDNQNTVKLDAKYTATPFTFSIASSAEITLASGLKLYPWQAGMPMIVLDMTGQAAKFNVNAQVDIPGQNGLTKIGVTGWLETNADGSLKSLDVKSQAQSEIIFPGGLRATDVNVRVVYANQSCGVEMSGKLDFGSGGNLDFSGNLEYNNANPQDIAFNVTLHPNVDITPFGNDIKIKISEFSMSLDTIPLKGSAHIKGELYLPDNKTIEVSGTITERSIFLSIEGAIDFPEFSAGGYSGKLTINSLEVGYSDGVVPPFHVAGSGSLQYKKENLDVMYCDVSVVEENGNIAIQLSCDNLTIRLPGGIKVEVDNATLTASTQEFDAAITGARVVYMPGAPKGLDGKNANINIKYLRFNKSLDNEFLFLVCEPAEGQANAGQLHLFPNQAEFDVNCLVIAYNYGAISPKPARPDCLPGGFQFSGTGLSLFAKGDLRITDPNLMNLPQLTATLTYSNSKIVVSAAFADQELMLPPNIIPPTTISDGFLELSFSDNTSNFGGKIGGTLKVGNNLNLTIDPANPLAIEAGTSGLKSFSGGVELKLDNQNTLKLDAKYTATPFTFSIASTADVMLGDVRLYPLQIGTPVLALDMGAGTTFAVNAQVDIPSQTGQNGLTKIGVTGTLETNPDGSLKLLDIKSQANLNLDLPGNIKLTQAIVEIEYETDKFFVKISGKFTLEQREFDVSGAVSYNQQTNDVGFEATSSFSGAPLTFGAPPMASIESGTLEFTVHTNPLSGSVVVKGSAVLFPSSSETSMAIEGFEGEFVFYANYFELLLKRGMLTLPDIFKTSVTIELEEQNPIKLRVHSGNVAFTGNLNFAFSPALETPEIGIMPGFVAKLSSFTLTFGAQIPSLNKVNGEITFPLPEYVQGEIPPKTQTIRINDFDWDLRGMPRGSIQFEDEFNLFNIENFMIQICGANCGSGCSTVVTFGEKNGEPSISIVGGLQVLFPLEVLTNEQGDSLILRGCGSLNIDGLGQDIIPDFKLNADYLEAIGNVHFGGEHGWLIQGATLRIEGFDYPRQPFVISLVGKLFVDSLVMGFEMGGMVGGLSNPARFTINTNKTISFSVPTMSVELGEESDAYLFQGKCLPCRISKVGLGFQDSNLPLSDIKFDDLQNLFAPENLIVVISGEIGLPTIEQSIFSGSVNDLAVRLDPENGWASVIDLNGFCLSANIKEITGINISGQMCIGGLGENATEDDLYFAGEMEVGGIGTANVKALVAAKLKGIVGVCFGLNSPVGIPLPLGFCLTGAEGGVSFTNNPGDPCDFTTYYFKSEDDKPQEGGRKANPLTSQPVLITWEKLIEENRNYHLREAANSLQEAIDSNMGEISLALNENECPTPDGCPPPSINLLCQPHPDTKPGTPLQDVKVIIRFSSIDESTLNDSLKIRPNSFNGMNVEQAVSHLVQELKGFLKQVLIPGDPIWKQEIEQKIDNFGDAMKNSLLGWIEKQGFPPNKPVYDIIKEAAYQGVPCPDITISLKANFSHVAFATGLYAQGGVVMSTAGSLGVVGKLILGGLTAGDTELYFTATDSQGNPNPGLCGSAVATLGPLDLGNMSMTLNCEGCMTGFIDATNQFTQCISVIFNDVLDKDAERFRELIQSVAPRLADEPLVIALLNLKEEECLALYSNIITRPDYWFEGLDVEKIAQIKECFRNLMLGYLESTNPVFKFCGSLDPKIFGVSLGKLAHGEVHITKDGISAETGVSYTGMWINWLKLTPLAPFVWAVGPLDYEKLGCNLPLSPLDAVKAALDGRLSTPEKSAQYFEESLRYFLENATFTGEFNLTPMGLEASCAGRVIMPDLTDYPSCREPEWTPPKPVNPVSLPSRSDIVIALQTCDPKRLSDPHWGGKEGDLSIEGLLDGLGPDGLKKYSKVEIDTFTQNLQNISLQHDYFPYGGMIAAFNLNVSDVIYKAPPLEDMKQIFESKLQNIGDLGPLFEKIQSFVENYLTHTSTVGILSVYLPAPKLPTCNLEDMTTSKILQLIAEQIDNEILKNAGAPFLRGIAQGQIFGIPLGSADIEYESPSLRIVCLLPENSLWKDFISSATLNFAFVPNEKPTQTAKDAIQVIISQVNNLSIVWDNLNNEEKKQGLENIQGNLQNAFIAQMPKVSLEAGAKFVTPYWLENYNIKIEGDGNIYAYSPMYNPDFPKNTQKGAGPVGDATRNGGLAVELANAQFGWITVDYAAFALSPPTHPDGMIGLSGLLDAKGMELPVPPVFSCVEAQKIGLQSIKVLFNTQAKDNDGNEYVLLEGNALLDPVKLCVQNQTDPPFLHIRHNDLSKPEDTPLEVKILFTQENSFSVSPAHATINLSGIKLEGAIYGDTPTDNFTFSTATDQPWAATVEGNCTVDLRVVNPDDPNQPISLMRIEDVYGNSAQIYFKASIKNELKDNEYVTTISTDLVLVGKKMVLWGSFNDLKQTIELPSGNLHLEADSKGNVNFIITDLDLPFAFPPTEDPFMKITCSQTSLKGNVFTGNPKVVFNLEQTNLVLFPNNPNMKAEYGINSLEITSKGEVDCNIGYKTLNLFPINNQPLAEISGDLRFGTRFVTPPEALGVSPGELDFGSPLVGETVTRELTLTNTDSYRQLKINIEVQPPFSCAVANPLTIPAPSRSNQNANAKVRINFKSENAGMFNSSLKLIDAGDPNKYATVNLSGTATDLEPIIVTIVPATFNFPIPVGQSASVPTRVINLGQRGGNVGLDNLPPGFSEGFGGRDPRPVPPSSAATFWINVDTNTAGDRSGDLRFFSNEGKNYTRKVNASVKRTPWTGQQAARETIKDVALSSTSNGFALAANGALLQTSNGGQTWSQSQFNPGVNMNSIQFSGGPLGGGAKMEPKTLDSNIGWIVGDRGAAYKTIDGGASWIHITDPAVNNPDVNWYAVALIEGDWSNSALLAGSGGYIAIENPSLSPQFFLIEPEPAGRDLLSIAGKYFEYGGYGSVAVGKEGTIRYSPRYLYEWFTYPLSPELEAFDLTGVKLGPTNRIYYDGDNWYETCLAIIVGDNGTILRGEFDTLAFDFTLLGSVKTPTTANLRSIERMSDNTWLVVGDGGVALRSTDDTGTSWTMEITPNRTDLLQVRRFSDKTFMTGRNGWIQSRRDNVDIPPQSLAISPAEIDFGTLVVGESQTEKVVLSNPGESDLIITDIQAIGDGFFASGFEPLPLIINPRQSFTISITYAPAHADAPDDLNSFNGQVQILSNDPDYPTMNVKLRGVAINEVNWYEYDPISPACDLVKVQFLSQQNGFALCKDQVFKTTDGGATWLGTAFDPLDEAITMQFFDASNGIIVGGTKEPLPNAHLEIEPDPMGDFCAKGQMDFAIKVTNNIVRPVGAYSLNVTWPSTVSYVSVRDGEFGVAPTADVKGNGGLFYAVNRSNTIANPALFIIRLNFVNFTGLAGETLIVSDGGNYQLEDTKVIKIPHDFDNRGGDLSCEKTLDFSASRGSESNVVFRRIPAGGFQMGSPDTDTWAVAAEKPQHLVTIPKRFYLAKTELTQAQFLAVISKWPNTPPSSTYGLGSTYPAYNISWNDCRVLINNLNKKGLGTFYLPSEAEWEYACRAGTTSQFNFGVHKCTQTGCDTCELSAYAWWCANSLNATHMVGSKTANTWGLYDMYGNVMEWVEDDTHANYTGAPTDGSAWIDSPRASERMLRGGSFDRYAGESRSASRSALTPSTFKPFSGVRLKFEPPAGSPPPDPAPCDTPCATMAQITSNGGASWQRSNYAMRYIITDVWMKTSTFGYAVTKKSPYLGGEPGAVIYTTNGGASWSNVTPQPPQPFDGRAVCSPQSNALFVANGASLYVRPPSSGWLLLSAIGTTHDINDIFFFDANYGWVIGDGGLFARTTTGGQNNPAWTLPTFSGLPANANLKEIRFISQSEGWLLLYDPAADQSGIFHTLDGGMSWEPQLGAPGDEIQSLHAVNSTTGFAVGKGGRFWKYRPTNLTPKGRISTPPLLDFGDTLTSMSVERSITIKNLGSGVLELASVQIRNAEGPGRVYILNSLPASLNPHEEANIQLQFIPEKAGSFSASLAIICGNADDGMVKTALQARVLEEPPVYIVTSDPLGIPIVVDDVLPAGTTPFYTLDWETSTTHKILIDEYWQREGEEVIYQFAGWSDGSSSTSLTVIADGASRTWIAQFIPAGFTVSAVEITTSTKSVTGSQSTMMNESKISAGNTWLEPFVIISNGKVKLTNPTYLIIPKQNDPGFNIQGELLLTSTQIHANIIMPDPFQIPSEDLRNTQIQGNTIPAGSLLKIGNPSQRGVAPLVWTLDASIASNPKYFMLSASNPPVHVLGKRVSSEGNLSLKFIAGDNSNFTFDALLDINDRLKIAPNLLEAQNPKLSLHCDNIRFTFNLNGEWYFFKNPLPDQNNWLATWDQELTITNQFKLELSREQLQSILNQSYLLGDNPILKIGLPELVTFSSFGFSGCAGSISNLPVKLWDQSEDMNFSGSFNTANQSFNLSAQLKDLPAGPLVLEKLPQQPNLRIGWNLSDPSFTLKLPAMKVVSRKNGNDKIISPWPEDGIIIDLPDVVFDGSFDFSGSNSFVFAGYNNSWNYWLKRQKNGGGNFALEAGFSGSQTFFGSQMSLYFNAKEVPQTGLLPRVDIEGALNGALYATICPICSPHCEDVRIMYLDLKTQVNGAICSFEGSFTVGAPCYVKTCDWWENCLTVRPELCVGVSISPTDSSLSFECD